MHNQVYSCQLLLIYKLFMTLSRQELYITANILCDLLHYVFRTSRGNLMMYFLNTHISRNLLFVSNYEIFCLRLKVLYSYIFTDNPTK